MAALENKHLEAFPLRAVPFAEFGAVQQLQQGGEDLLHVKDAALLLVDVRSINDNAFEILRLQGS